MAGRADDLKNPREFLACGQVGVEACRPNALPFDPAGRVAMNLSAFASVAEGTAKAAKRRIEPARADFGAIGEGPVFDGIGGKATNLDLSQVTAVDSFPRAQKRLYGLPSVVLRTDGEAALALYACF